MNEPDQPSELGKITIHIDWRPLNTQHAISALRRYLDIMEHQMPSIETCELASFDAENSPTGNDPDEYSAFTGERDYLEQILKEDLVPTMRYSFVVFIHIVFETRLRAFCAAMQHERKLPLSLTDIRGSAIEQARIYLAKLVGVAVGDYPEWSHLRSLQLVRDCIVHSYGYLNSEDDRSKHLRKLATQDIGLSITEDDRISLTSAFCNRHLTSLSNLFSQLFQFAGWKP